MRNELNKKAEFVSKEGILIGKEDVAWKRSVVRTKRGNEREELNCQEFVEKAWLKEKTCIQTNAWPNENEFD